ncbi:MAG: Mur ligase family protein [Candidatus Saccharimonadales bacterium]
MSIKREILSLYSPRLPHQLTYMLQASEYRTDAYMAWLMRTRDFSLVQHRRTLDRTKKAKLIEAFLSIGMLLELLAGVALIVYGAITGGASWSWEIGTALIMAYPFIWSYLVLLPLEFGRLLIVEPSQARRVKSSSATFNQHPALKIAVAGSYGKTSMKELLTTVIGAGKRVASTTANRNVAIEHAKFASRLDGKDDVLIIEYGEGAPGDVAAFAKNTHPDMAIITGLAPAHLDRYKTMAKAGEDIFSLAEYLKGKSVYVNGDSEALKPFIKKDYSVYGQGGVGEWKVSAVKLSINGISFNLSNGKSKLNLASKLLGRHQIGPLSLAAALGIKFGLTPTAVEDAIKNAEPYEHRMQPYNLHGAWIIDDTYNGNIDGIQAGTELLKELEAKRKIYVTPGLVDQGKETEAVHLSLGKLVTAAAPDLVVLMQNSVTKYIMSGLTESGYQGELKIVDDPLSFYSNLDSFVAAGDLVLMQNDWTDNYA